ncbi:hypothetical protein HanPI659440_Chr07g0271561 [Helianthus annuus]|nr:hypothetical protein HanPI659440_Chr07g0271561 [Helianthus annuus]
MEHEHLSMKDKLQRTPDTEKNVSQLNRDLAAQKERIKALAAQCQSAQVAAASAGEERGKVAAELTRFAAVMKESDKAYKDLLAKMEESLSQARDAYERMAKVKDFHKSGEADLKAKIQAMEKRHGTELEDLKLEIVDFSKRVEELQAIKACFLTESTSCLAKYGLAKYVHKGPEMTQAVAAVNNAMSALGVNTRVHGGYVHALKRKTPYGEVPLLNKDAEAQLDLDAAVSNFDSLWFPLVDNLAALVNEPLPQIQEDLGFKEEKPNEGNEV